MKARPAADSAARAPTSDDTVAAQRVAFDAQQAEHAELLRELDALETLLLAQLKNEDEIMKKWIALI
ncbi:MAG TPA: hypothetical protein VIN40_07415 [Candidatus Tyrphobacter sp.]